jgi:hypothetical protein
VKPQGQLDQLGSRCIGVAAMVDESRVGVGKTHNGCHQGSYIYGFWSPFVHDKESIPYLSSIKFLLIFLVGIQSGLREEHSDGEILFLFLRS